VTFDELGPFDTVLDVGGNVGEFAELCRRTWPECRVTSFEPVPPCARENRRRSGGRWWVEECALSSHAGTSTIRVCLNQPSASTMQEPGTTRRDRFGIVDRFEVLEVRTRTLDEFELAAGGRCLVKIDVEGHELAVLEGGGRLLERVACVVVEVNEDPHVFEGAPPPEVVDAELRRHGLYFAGVLAVQLDPAGAVVQFDGAWRR
jgi:FkbM family methyltransferase